MGKIEYSLFEKEDCIEVLNFWRNIDGIYLHQNGEDSEEGITAYLDRNPGLSFIAKSEDKIVGAILCGHDGRRGFIHHLAVHQNYRKQNIGNHLMEMSLSKLKEVGIRKCVLFVLKENPEAESFYKHLNWQKETIINMYSQLLH